MTESNDPSLAVQCAQCGTLFVRRHYVSHGKPKDGKPVPAKYCSPACRKEAYRQRLKVPSDAAQGQGTAATHQNGPVPQGGPSQDPVPFHPNAFARLQGDAVLSQWKPSGDGKDVPPIPEFLRRS